MTLSYAIALCLAAALVVAVYYFGKGAGWDEAIEYYEKKRRRANKNRRQVMTGNENRNDNGNVENDK